MKANAGLLTCTKSTKRLQLIVIWSTIGSAGSEPKGQKM